jgi:2-phosphosulfolactate phosphatase
MKISTCFSPAQYPLFHMEDSIVVVVDVFRATSAICTAFENGVAAIVPVATIEEAIALKQKGYLAAAERDGKVVDGFELGNSPYDYQPENIKDKKVVLSTTNGTQAIEAAKYASQLLIGSFVNISAIADYLIGEDKDVTILCAGWKNKFNLEDTLFAGALSKMLVEKSKASTDCDSTIAAQQLYDLAHQDLFAFLEKSSHRIRLKNLNLDKDIRYCLTFDSCKSVPILKNGELVKLASTLQNY